MSKKKYRGRILFSDGSKIILPFHNDKAMARKTLLQQFQFSQKYGSKYYKSNDSINGNLECLNNNVSIKKKWIEIWECIGEMDNEDF